MAGDEGDVLMMIIDSDGKGVPAECQTVLATGRDKDPLMTEFQAGQFCEITDFDVGINVEDRDDSGESGGKDKDKDKEKSKSKTSKFTRWMSMPIGSFSGDADATGGYPVDLDSVSCSRQMDSASPVLLTACSQKRSFKKIIIVKRKDIGSNVGPQAYLRFEFADVLVIGISWENGVTVKEKCKFICRQLVMQYRPQLHAGKLDAVSKPGQWTRKMETKT